MEMDNMDVVNQFNEETDAEVVNDMCSKIAQDIIAGELTIVRLLEQLRDLLINTSPSRRKLGVVIITEVLHNLPVEFFNVHELEIISTFYTDKLSEQHQVIPTVLKGILTVIRFKQFPGESVPPLLTAIFRNVACQQQQQADRHTIYTIFQHLLERHRKELLSMKLDFVYGVISSIDGERDPRNLLFLFNWLNTFLKAIPLGHLTEEMFEVMACYFPVDFKAPPSESISVTREDLSNALCPCLCAIPEFSEYCITLALEKLDSSFEIAKLDSFKLLREGCSVFDVSSYTEHALEIWSQIQKVVFSDVDDEVKKESLRTLSAVINKMSQTNNEHFNYILKDISDTVKGNLLPGSKLFQQSADILFHIALASQESAAYMKKEIVPLLTNTLNITTASDKKAIILKTIVPFVKIYLNQYNEVDLSKHEELEAIPLLCLKASMDIESSLVTTGFDGLSELAESLPFPIRKSLYEGLHKMLITSQEQNVRNSILNCFEKLSTVYPDEINENVLYKIKINDPHSLELYLNALGVIAHVNYFKDIVIDTLLSYAAENISLAVIAMKNITSLLEKESKNNTVLETFLQKGTINKFVEYIVAQDVTNRSRIEILLDIASIFKILIGSQQYETQDKIIKQQLISINNYKEEFEEIYVFLLDGLLSRYRKALPLDQDIVKLLIRISLTNTNDLVRNTAVQLLANLINKQADGDGFNNHLDIIKEDCLTHINSDKSNVIVILSWITKALIMRNHFQANLWIELLLDMLQQDGEVAKGFRIIMNDNYESLSATSYCNKKLLYRQKCFVFITNKLIVSYTPEKRSYLTAVGYLIEYAPEQAILLQFNKIKKLIILCLEQCSDHEVLCVLLNKISGFILNKESVIQESLEDFLTRILTLSTFEHSMKVRIFALQCLSHFTTSFPLYRLLPFKQKVLRELGVCIDDKKRLVRKEAVNARTLWFLLDAPI